MKHRCAWAFSHDSWAFTCTQGTYRWHSPFYFSLIMLEKKIKNRRSAYMWAVNKYMCHNYINGTVACSFLPFPFQKYDSCFLCPPLPPPCHFTTLTWGKSKIVVLVLKRIFCCFSWGGWRAAVFFNGFQWKVARLCHNLICIVVSLVFSRWSFA